MVVGDSIDQFSQLSDIERKFLGFVVQSSSGERKTVSPFVKETETPLKAIAKNLYKIRHWKIYNTSFEEITNKEATWFIDPPYQFGGHEYKESNKKIYFVNLSNWCKSRKGQIIVCENTKANWLDFYPLKEMRGCQFTTTEAIWTNLPSSYKQKQMNLFS